MKTIGKMVAFLLASWLFGCATGRVAQVYQPLPELLKEAMAVRKVEGRQKRLLKIAALHPESPVPYFLIAQSFEREGRIRDAQLNYERALAIRPDCASCHEALGQILTRCGQPELGKKHLEKAKLFDTGGDS